MPIRTNTIAEEKISSVVGRLPQIVHSQDLFAAMTPRDAIGFVWDGWDILALRPYRHGCSRLYLTALMRNGDVWAATNVLLHHDLHIDDLDLFDDEARIDDHEIAWPQWLLDHTHSLPVNINPYWDALSGDERAKAVGWDAFNDGMPCGLGAAGLAEHISDVLSPDNDNSVNSYRWNMHQRIADLLLSFDTSTLDEQTVHEVHATRMLVELAGDDGLLDHLDYAADDRLGP